MTTTRNHSSLIAKLLAKAESTKSEPERDALLAKASELQLEHMIDDSDIRAAENTHTFTDELNTSTVTGLTKGSGYVKARRDLVTGLAVILNCRVTMAADRSALYLHGHSSDRTFIQSLFDSLSLQLISHMNHDARRDVRSGSRAWRTSYAHGWVNRVVHRFGLARAGQEFTASETPGTALVLRDRAAAVNAYYTERHAGAKLRQGYSNRSVRDADGYGAGRAAADRASIGGTPIGSTRKGVRA